MTLPEVVAGGILVCLMIYVPLAGADFGGGVWDLLARGPRADAQRRTISHAIAPVWEANHIWMIVAVVLLFTAFPSAFALVLTHLHVPLTVMLIGIVLRGSAFVIRKTTEEEERAAPGWQLVFSVSSLVTPITLGVIVGTISMGSIECGTPPRDLGAFFRPWLHPFPFAVGLFALALFAFLAATYLTLDTDDPELVEDFRRRALASGAGVLLTGAATALLALIEAREVADHLWSSREGLLGVAAGVLALLGGLRSLWVRRFRWARVFAASSSALILLGWGLALHPWIVVGCLTVEEAAADPIVLRIALGILGGGAILLLPAFWFLFRVFKGPLLRG
ncbi:MAG: cytochrome d ubiquinol oxidase subunit II [Gemmatimonadota bacterium]